MSRAVIADRVRGAFEVRCPNKKCKQLIPIHHSRVDKKLTCPGCKSRFVPRDNLVRK